MAAMLQPTSAKAKKPVGPASKSMRPMETAELVAGIAAKAKLVVKRVLAWVFFMKVRSVKCPQQRN
jgi:hypothetical protein